MGGWGLSVRGKLVHCAVYFVHDEHTLLTAETATLIDIYPNMQFQVTPLVPSLLDHLLLLLGLITRRME